MKYTSALSADPSINQGRAPIQTRYTPFSFHFRYRWTRWGSTSKNGSLYHKKKSCLLFQVRCTNTDDSNTLSQEQIKFLPSGLRRNSVKLPKSGNWADGPGIFSHRFMNWISTFEWFSTATRVKFELKQTWYRLIKKKVTKTALVAAITSPGDLTA